MPPEQFVGLGTYQKKPVRMRNLVILILVAKLNMYGRATISLHIPIRNCRY